MTDSITDSIMQDNQVKAAAQPKVLYYCDIATEFVDDVPTAWCEWRGDQEQVAYHYRDEFVEIWRCPQCGWEWVVYLDGDGDWWEEKY